jgi:hypothetical protein
MDSGYDITESLNIFFLNRNLRLLPKLKSIMPSNPQLDSMISKEHQSTVVIIKYITGVITTDLTNLDAHMYIAKLSLFTELNCNLSN